MSGRSTALLLYRSISSLTSKALSAGLVSAAASPLRSTSSARAAANRSLKLIGRAACAATSWPGSGSRAPQIATLLALLAHRPFPPGLGALFSEISAALRPLSMLIVGPSAGTLSGLPCSGPSLTGEVPGPESYSRKQAAPFDPSPLRAEPCKGTSRGPRHGLLARSALFSASEPRSNSLCPCLGCSCSFSSLSWARIAWSFSCSVSLVIIVLFGGRLRWCSVPPKTSACGSRPSAADMEWLGFGFVCEEGEGDFSVSKTSKSFAASGVPGNASCKRSRRPLCVHRLWCYQRVHPLAIGASVRQAGLTRK